MIEQAFAGRCQFDAAAAARQQRNAECVLQSLDPLAPRGQREMNPLRAVGDAARLGNRDEELKIDQIETHGIPRGTIRAETVIASEAKQSISHYAATWIASLRSQ